MGWRHEDAKQNQFYYTIDGKGVIIEHAQGQHVMA